MKIKKVSKLRQLELEVEVLKAKVKELQEHPILNYPYYIIPATKYPISSLIT